MVCNIHEPKFESMVKTCASTIDNPLIKLMSTLKGRGQMARTQGAMWTT